MTEAPIVAPCSVGFQDPLGLPPLPREFYARGAVEVARAVLGHVLVHGGRAGRIVEVEAYLGETDRAAHAWHGRTRRTEVLYGPPGHAYIYLIYGMYECLNLVADAEGAPGCVLVRALEPLLGMEAMRAARPSARRGNAVCSGPGNLTRAMGITRRHYGADLTSGDLTLRRAHDHDPLPGITTTGRIGIRHGADLPLRFFLTDNPCVSARG